MVIGFLGFRDFDDGKSYRGAILVADELSKPLEFRCTAPIRPTRLQRTLYGKSLVPHILTELIGVPLISSIETIPELILIADEGFIELREKVAIPLLRVTLTGDGSEPAKDVTFVRSSSDGQAESSGKVPARLQAHRNYEDDLTKCSELLRILMLRWNLLEPFSRVNAGLQYVHDEHALEN